MQGLFNNVNLFFWTSYRQTEYIIWMSRVLPLVLKLRNSWPHTVEFWSSCVGRDVMIILSEQFIYTLIKSETVFHYFVSKCMWRIHVWDNFLQNYFPLHSNSQPLPYDFLNHKCWNELSFVQIFQLNSHTIMHPLWQILQSTEQSP